MGIPPSSDSFSVGWVCPLAIELTAARTMLDEEYQTLDSQSNGDDVIYTLGRIGHHNIIVMASLPKMGTNPAVALVDQIRNKFRKVVFFLLVGIGGGVPRYGSPGRESDISMGDVVVSYPRGRYGGVMHYDFGAESDGGFQFGGHTNAPPILLNAVNKLRSDHQLQPGTRIPQFLEEMQGKLSATERKHFQRQNHDRLFPTEYIHEKTGVPCDKCCILENSIIRKVRESPMIHYGTIGSANKLMKSSSTRDQLSKQHGVICFEMEAAGIMDITGCLVIRGICDYADSHKDKSWQEYAAATAACYSKELLHIIPVQISHSEGSDQSDLDTKDLLPDDPKIFMALSRTKDWELGTTTASHDIFSHLSDYEPHRIHLNYLHTRCRGTTDWIIKDEHFQAWNVEQHSSCLWLTGKIGSGKTIITSTVIEWISRQHQQGGDFLAHFFFQHGNRPLLTASQLFRSYSKQIIGYLYITRKPCPLNITSFIKRLFSPNAKPSTLNEIVHEVFIPLSRLISKATYILDGLDDCKENEVPIVLGIFQEMMTKDDTKIFISGRESLHVSSYIQNAHILCISKNNTKEDIKRFIDSRIEWKMRQRPLTTNKDVLHDIKIALNEGADRMILWVNLQLEALWEDCFTDVHIQAALANLPKDLNETYNRCLRRINKRQSPYAKKALGWVCASVKPFNITQLAEAFAINEHTGCLERDKIPPEEVVLTCCSNLLIKDNCGQVLLAHNSVYQFLLANSEDLKLFPQGFHLHDIKIELGELCVAHLSSDDYALSLQSSNLNNNLPTSLSSTGVETLLNFPSLLKTVLPKPREVQFRIPTLPSKASSVVKAGIPSFFCFAKEHWLPLTCRIDKTSRYWETFSELAINQNITWNIHPWTPLGQSRNSHYSALLGWAILNQHLPLVNILFGLRNFTPNSEIFKIPCGHYGNIPPLHLASRGGNCEIMKQLLRVCDPKQIDKDHRTVLHHAAETGQLSIAELMIQKRVNIEVQDSSGQTALHFAAENGQIPILKFLLKNGAKTESKDNQSQTPLVCAAKRGHEDAVRLLLADNPINERRITKLHDWALENGNATMIKVLIEIGATVDLNKHHQKLNSLAENGGDEAFVKLIIDNVATFESRNEDFQTPLSLAALNGHETVVKLLLKGGAQLESNNGSAQTPLSLAALNGHETITELLLKSNANFEWKDVNGQSPLSLAASNGHEAVVKLLLKSGAYLESIDKHGQSPLLLVANNGHTAIMKLLIDSGANVESKDKYGESPLLLAARNGNTALIKLLINSGANIELKDRFDHTPLYLAALHGHETAVKLLVNNGANIESKDGDQAPLLRAAGNGHEAVVKLLINNGANMETEDTFNQTPLSLAAENGHEAVVKLLIDNGANMETGDRLSQTPLSWAARNDHKTVIKLLINNGANMESEDRYHQTPLSWAAKNGNEAVMKLLIENGAKGVLKYDPATLSLAAKNGHEAIVKLLIDSGANISYLHFQDALVLAAKNGHEAIVKLLNDNDAIRRPIYQSTSFLARSGYNSVMRLLIDNGVNPELKEICGQSPLQLAAERGLEDEYAKMILSELGTQLSNIWDRRQR